MQPAFDKARASRAVENQLVVVATKTVGFTFTKPLTPAKSKKPTWRDAGNSI